MAGREQPFGERLPAGSSIAAAEELPYRGGGLSSDLPTSFTTLRVIAARCVRESWRV